MSDCFLTLVLAKEEVVQIGEESILDLPKNVNMNFLPLMGIVLLNEVIYIMKLFIYLYLFFVFYEGNSNGYDRGTV